MLQIRKKGNKNFWHYYGTFEYSASDVRVSVSGDTFIFTRENGAIIFLKSGFNVTDISVYDDTGAGTEETFVDPIVLINRLVDIGYIAYYEEGDIIVPSLDDLTDVTIATANDGDVLTYNSTTGQWENAIGTSSSQNPIENEYADVAAMLADQGNQTTNYFQYVTGTDEYYEKLSTNTASISDYRLLSDTETTTILDSNSYRVFRIAAIQDEAVPLTSTSGGSISFEYNGADVTAILLNRNYTRAVAEFYGTDVSIRFYNRTTRVYEWADVDAANWSVVNTIYNRLEVTGTNIQIGSLTVNDRVEFFIWQRSASGGGGGATLTEDVNQVAHGFAVGDAIYNDGADFQKGQADALATSAVLGVVSAVADVDNFTYQFGGIMTTGTWTEGTDYFLSVSTAGLVSTEPTYNDGEVRQYIGTGVATGLLINIDIGDEVVSVPARPDDRYVEASHSGTGGSAYDLDYSLYEVWNLTLTGASEFTESNLPTTGTYSKTIVLRVTGDFALTFPAAWSTDITGTYDGTVSNLILVQYFKTGVYKVIITQPD